MKGCPGTTFGGWWKLERLLKFGLGKALVSLALTIGTGLPLCAVMTVFSCQPSAKHRGPKSFGTWWVKAPVNRCRVSKFDGPCSACRLVESCGKATVEKLKSIASEASSSDFDQVY